MRVSAFLSLSLWVGGLLVSEVSRATVYDPAAAFSPNANPNGVWSYGYSPTLGGAMVLDPEQAQDNGISVWRTNIWLGAPAVFHNGTSGTLTNSTGTLVMPPGALGLHPGPGGQYSLLRFTAPAADTYQIAAAFSGLDIDGTTTDVHVLTNGAPAFNGLVNGYGPGPSCQTTVALKAGDTIDFAVGWGANQEFSFDATGLSAQITSATTGPGGCAAPPPGLVSWWPAEGNASDVVGANNPSSLNGTTFATGEVGTGFSFNGVNNYIDISATPAITVGLSNGFTVEGWIKPANNTASMVIVEYERVLGTYSSDDVGLDFSVNSHGVGTIDGNIKASDQANHEFGSSPNVITPGVWQHVAVTYDRGSGLAQFWVNGSSVLATNIGSFIPLTSFTNVLLGGRTTFTSAQAPNTVFAGGMDELSIYNRALTAQEIQSIYAAGAAGKCLPGAVPGCLTPPSGLVSWWRMEGNAADSAGANTGTLLGNASFGAGKVGQALVLDGQGAAVNLAAASTLYLHTFTLETWLRRASATVTSFEGNGNGTLFALGGPGGLGLFLDTSGQPVFGQTWYDTISAGVSITDTNWHHLAVTEDQNSVVFYLDGVAHPAGAFNTGFNGGTPAMLGGWFYNGAVQNSFYGAIDEMSVYDRALSAGEIQALYAADDAGKCVGPIPPTIVAQPLNQTISSGANASFSVSASGTQPLSYQWLLNGAPLGGQTSSTLALSGVQVTNGGTYAVVVSNGAGSLLSSNALLTVTSPTCTPPSPGQVGWWKGEANALDSAGTNNGMASGALTYSTAEVGLGFLLDGSTATLRVPYSPSLRLTNALTLETWVLPTQSNLFQNIMTKWDAFSGLSQKCFTLALDDLNQPYFTVCPSGLDADAVTVTGTAGTVPVGQWTHLAATYDGASIKLYVNGNLQGSLPYSAGIYPGNNELTIGSDGPLYFFAGRIDEASVYSRGLSAGEIQAVYSAGAAGKCLNLVAPVITSEPTNEVAELGASASFSVAATGTPPLFYQWFFNGAKLSGRTTSALNLFNVQLTNVGTYSVVVSNFVGTVPSSNAVLTVEVPACTAPPTGLVSWWRGNGNTADSAGANPGTAVGNLVYRNGESGQAFYLDGVNAHIFVPASPSLDVGKGPGLTIEAWVKPDATNVLNPVVEWNNTPPQNGYYYGAQLWLTHPDFGAGNFFANLVDITGNQSWHVIKSPPRMIQPGVFQHVAVTYDKASGVAVLYYNGSPVTVTNLGSFTPQTSYPLYLGQRPPGDANSRTFKGAMDEISIYKRALTATEVQNIYAAGAGGKCFTPVGPTITSQPQSVVTNVGLNASFSVAAAGAPSPTYQWLFNGVPLAGRTTPALQLVNVQLTNSGTYSVVVSNQAGVVVSSNALLTVTMPDCVAPPVGIVSWWRGESNALDSISGNLTLPSSSVGYASGEVGQGFLLNGGTANLRVPYNPSLRLTNGLTFEAWVLPLRSNAYQSLITRWDVSSGPVQKCFALALNPLNQLYLTLSPSGSDINKLTVTATNGLPLNQWSHVAGTYDGSALRVYVNGSLQGFAPYTAGAYPGTNDITLGSDGPLYYFAGRMDEVAIYSRALTPLEIQAIYTATVVGKCTTPAYIVSQPASLDLIEGSNATFNVTAGGDPLLHYQWAFNGTGIPGATKASLVLTNVQWTNAGSYSVLVGNGFGGQMSSNAVLTVDRIPVAQCASVVVAAGPNCTAPASIDQGSYDLDGDPLTLTQSPAGPYPLGTNLVTLTVSDNRGASNACSALVVVLDQTPPILTLPADIVVTNAHSAWTSVVTYAPTATDNCSGVGLPVCNPPSGSAFSLGTTTVNVTVADAAGNTAHGSFKVTVLPGNVPPVPIIEVHPLAHFPGNTNLIVIASNNQQATVVLDGSKSYDLDDTNFLSFWYEGTNLLSTNLVATTVLNLGTNDITLWLDDTFPLGTNSASAEVQVISPMQAVALIAGLLNDPAKGHNQSLLASLNAATAAFNRGDINAGVNELQAFENKLSAQLAAQNPDLAAELTQAAQQVINALSAPVAAGPAHVKFLSLAHQAGKMHLKFAGTPGQIHLVQASNNLRDWQTIGVATESGNGSFDYEDAKAAAAPARFYRIVAP